MSSLYSTKLKIMLILKYMGKHKQYELPVLLLLFKLFISFTDHTYNISIYRNINIFLKYTVWVNISNTNYYFYYSNYFLALQIIHTIYQCIRISIYFKNILINIINTNYYYYYSNYLLALQIIHKIYQYIRISKYF